MPASKRPALQDALTATRILLDGLARDADIFGIVSELTPLHPRNNTFPGEVFLRLGADALDWCGASRADPVSLEGIRERFLPESDVPHFSIAFWPPLTSALVNVVRGGSLLGGCLAEQDLARVG